MSHLTVMTHILCSCVFVTVYFILPGYIEFTVSYSRLMRHNLSTLELVCACGNVQVFLLRGLDHGP